MFARLVASRPFSLFQSTAKARPSPPSTRPADCLQDQGLSARQEYTFLRIKSIGGRRRTDGDYWALPCPPTWVELVELIRTLYATTLYPEIRIHVTQLEQDYEKLPMLHAKLWEIYRLFLSPNELLLVRFLNEEGTQGTVEDVGSAGYIEPVRDKPAKSVEISVIFLLHADIVSRMVFVIDENMSVTWVRDKMLMWAKTDFCPEAVAVRSLRVTAACSSSLGKELVGSMSLAEVGLGKQASMECVLEIPEGI